MDSGVVHHGFGQANPIKHARLTLDCDCTFDLNDIMPKTLKTDCESGTCSREFTGEYKALRKVRNSNGQASKVSLSNREYLKAKCATYDQKYHYTIDEESTQKNKYECKSNLDVSCCTTWKPTNHYYVQDGGVSSSTNTQKKKYNSIQSTAKSMEAAFDAWSYDCSCLFWKTRSSLHQKVKPNRQCVECLKEQELNRDVKKIKIIIIYIWFI